MDNKIANDVYCSLKNYNRNIEIIKSRRKILAKKFNIKFNKYRLGPVVIFPNHLSKELDHYRKHFNFKKNVFNEKFNKCIIFPIHFGISKKKFKNLINLFSKYFKKVV